MTVIFAPFYGEFGHFVMEHIRLVHAYDGEKIVCCEKGQECLFPTAKEFYTDWKNPIPDSNRTLSGAYSSKQEYEEEKQATLRRIQETYPRIEILTNIQYPCRWHTSDAVKFKPAVLKELASVDIAIGTRKRGFGSNRNYCYYDNLAEIFRESGLRVGIVGARETSFNFEADAKAWHYSAGPTAGSVDILSNCKLYVGIDSGITHLAALMDVPTFYFTWEVQYDYSGVAERANKKFFHRFIGDPHRYDSMAQEILRIYTSLEKP